ncbi:amidohydrolase [Aureivirga marina]|uniref:amidohydrolase n=1 Tax=Aureivirga marina TaxID=1182451 RepID=UPI0018CA907B|nr:amidohydrolase [Aureivirga marina]
MKKRKIIILVFVLFLLPILFYFFSKNPHDVVSYPEILVKNAKIYTQDSIHPWAEAMLVKNGKIKYIGTNNEAKKQSSSKAKVINAKNKLILPAFIDSHTHPGLVSWFSDKIIGIPEGTIEEKLQWLKKYAEENPDVPYIIAGSWNWYDFGKEGPNKRDIDAVVKDIPVILLEGIGHSLWVNSKTLEVLGVDKNTKEGVEDLSFYYKDENGELTGWIKEFVAYPKMIELLKAKESKNVDLVLEMFLNHLSSQGITTIFDAGNMTLNDETYSRVAKLDKKGKLPMRYEASYHIVIPEQVKKAVPEIKRLRQKYQTENLRFNTVKIHFDGIIQIRTAAIKEPYRDDLDNHGNTLLNEEELTSFLKDLNKENINLHLHTIGDQAIHIAINSYENLVNSLENKESLKTKLTISHLEYIDPDDVSRIKKLGIIANFTPQWFGYPQHYLAHMIGERAEHRMEAKTLMDSGADVTFSSDVISPLEYLRSSPLLGIQVGHNRQNIYGGKEAPITLPIKERLSIEELIKGYTINGAKQLELNERIGSLEVGKEADFIILDKNIFETDRYDIYNTKVEKTFKNGKEVYRRNFKAIVNDFFLSLIL